MKFSTLFKRSLAVATLVASVGFMASAQTFIHEGVVYKVNKGKLEAQKPDKTPENGEAPGVYDGNYNIPSFITYNETEYPVSKIGTVFKGQPLKSIVLGDGIALAQGSFMGCSELVSAVLPSDLPKFFASVFQDCVKLESITIPGTVPEIMAGVFKGCTSLKEVVIADGEAPIEMQLTSFGADHVIEKVTINRAIGTKYTDMGTKPFRGSKTLKEVVVGGSCTSFQASYFENASALSSITFNNEFTSFDTNVFVGTAFTEVVLPESVTSLPAGMFKNAKSLAKVTVGSAVTSFGGEAFANTAVAEINFPETLTSIGVSAFANAALAGDLVLPAAVKTISNQAFANNAGLTSISIPASVTTIGTGAFAGCTGLTSFDVAAENETYAVSADKKYITSKDGATLVAYAAAAEGSEFTGAFTAVEPYAFYGAKNLVSIDLPECQTYGDYAFYGSQALKALELRGNMGRNLAAGSTALETLTIDAPKVPAGVAANCPALTKVNLPKPVAVVAQEAFMGCTALESLDLGNILSILESNCFTGSAIKALSVGAYYPAAMAEGVFFTSSTDEEGNPLYNLVTTGDELTVTVPASLVDTYKQASGWDHALTIVGDANMAIGGENLGMPAGLYYAGDDSNLHCVYADGETTDYEVGLDHMFQLVEFSNRIYGACAGRIFWYQNTPIADGKLFYISQVGSEVFQATVLDNVGGNAYKDPTGLYIYGDTLYVNDRNVCVRKIAAGALALPMDYPSWMENNWMPFYSDPWSYGCIKSGFAITQSQDAEGNPEPRYWLAMKTNGQGLFSFKEKNVGTSSSAVGINNDDAKRYLTSISPIITAFNIDEKHGFIYLYIENGGTADYPIKGGVYRISLEALEQTPNPSAADFFDALAPELVDGAPVLYEGNATHEHVGVSQFSIDANGEYMYWCYRAPSAEEAAEREALSWGDGAAAGTYLWATPYDAENPLHQSGIKRIKLGAELPEVEMVAPGVTGYGVVAVNYEGSKKPDGVESVVTETVVEAVAVEGGEVVAAEDAVVCVYNAAGIAVSYAKLAAGEVLSLDDLGAGIYVVEATTAAGKQAVKVVK